MLQYSYNYVIIGDNCYFLSYFTEIIDLDNSPPKSQFFFGKKFLYRISNERCHNVPFRKKIQ